MIEGKRVQIMAGVDNDLQPFVQVENMPSNCRMPPDDAKALAMILLAASGVAEWDRNLGQFLVRNGKTAQEAQLTIAAIHGNEPTGSAVFTSERTVM